MATRSDGPDSKQRAGGLARAQKLTAEKRSEIARAAAVKRWEGKRMSETDHRMADAVNQDIMARHARWISQDVRNVGPDWMQTEQVKSHDERAQLAYASGLGLQTAQTGLQQRRTAQLATHQTGVIAGAQDRSAEDLRKWALELAAKAGHDRIFEVADRLVRYVQTGSAEPAE